MHSFGRIVKIIKKKIAYSVYFFRTIYLVYVSRDSFSIEMNKWFKLDGDKSLRLEYDLSECSIVFDVGGYEGGFAEEIYNKYNCFVYVFEPSMEYFKICEERFKENDKISCFNFGLSDVDAELPLTNSKDASSLINHAEGGGTEVVCVRRFHNVFNELEITNVDLMKINIEGAEYALLEHMIEVDVIKYIKDIQIQFHNFVEFAAERRQNIISVLTDTHSQSWCFLFVWESWERKL